MEFGLSILAAQASLLIIKIICMGKKINQTIFCVVDGSGRSRWLRCGSMRSNRRGGYEISFDIVPVPSKVRLVSLPVNLQPNKGVIRRLVGWLAGCGISFVCY